MTATANSAPTDSSAAAATASGLNELIVDIGKFVDSANPNSYDYVIDNLVKTKKLLTLSAAQQQQQNNNANTLSSNNSSLAADKYLKSALNNLSDFMSEMELSTTQQQQPPAAATTTTITSMQLVVSERKNYLKSVYKRMHTLMDQSLLARQKSSSTPATAIEDSRGRTGLGGGGPAVSSSSAGVSPASAEPNFLNDWILSDFNLVSNDFNNELSFIAGNLFDLSFNYKLVRLLNDKCFLVRTKSHQTNDESDSNNGANNAENEFYLLKVIPLPSNGWFIHQLYL